MGDWSILGRFLSEVQNHSTVIGKIWLTMLLIFRILLVALVGDAVYNDEQSKFTCNTQQPGCNNVCYDTFAPVSHLRFWVFQIVLVSTPSIFYIVFVLHKIAKDEKLDGQRAQVLRQSPSRQGMGQKDGKEKMRVGVPTYCPHFREDWDETERTQHSFLEEGHGALAEDPTKQSKQVLLIYILHVFLRSIMEITFLVGQYLLFGFEVPHLYRCETYPCPTRTDCFVSRATEKTIFLNFMFSISLGCFVLNIAELHYLGWVYIFRVLCSTCSNCCGQEKVPDKMYSKQNPLLLQLRHSLRGQLVLQTRSAMAQEKTGGLLTHAPAISFETDSTVECTSKRSPENMDKVKVKLANMARLGRTKKSWL
ncbi:gap junction delta-2 protein [Corythoichthys intestinalis]|uniref:gap junction delta-2 protein n=1 Tax=Corythoichthys intestinalis TaxID=161448 RepID=UPI0025A52295|nr:gap junction delta-2 protein [Corythoichthys intestinalis]XP_061797347.1 gap junction delta-2 protein-like [Nerophis lumbriciformis]